MVLYKTKEISKFADKIIMLESLATRFPITWQSFFDGEYLSILVGKDGEI